MAFAVCVQGEKKSWIQFFLEPFTCSHLDIAEKFGAASGSHIRVSFANPTRPRAPGTKISGNLYADLGSCFAWTVHRAPDRRVQHSA
eukprot:6016337-Pyramimonas_sp.AAC.1